MPSVYMIGGPNGAGKTTTAMSLLPGDLSCEEFINADGIATGLSPFHPESVAVEAGKLMLRRIRSLSALGHDFAFESTMAARSFAPFLLGLKREGYKVHTIFLWLPSVDLALARVAMRVKAGGHGIPEDTIRRRYRSGIRNLFDLYMPLSDAWSLYDNSGADPKRVASGTSGGRVAVVDGEGWLSIQEYKHNENA